MEAFNINLTPNELRMPICFMESEATAGSSSKAMIVYCQS